MFDKTSDILGILVAGILLFVLWRFYIDKNKKKKSILADEVRIDAKNKNVVEDDTDTRESEESEETTEDTILKRGNNPPDLIKIPRAKIVRQPDPIPDEMSGQFNTGIIDMSPWVQYHPQLQGTHEMRVDSNIYDPLGIPPVGLGPLGPPGAPGFGPPEGAAGGFRA